MNFGPSFLNWIKTFYTNIYSCVVNNGYLSEFFSLQRGVRQGCSLSGLLFVLAVEPLAHQIRIDESIKGLENGNKITKLSMYADDTTYSKDPRNANEYKQEIIWNNWFIKIDGKSFYYRSWANKGILKISDVLNTHGHFKCKHGVRSTFFDYAGVLAAIPKIWKSKIVGNFTNGNNEPVPSLDICSTKKAHVMLAERSFSPPHR